MFFSYFLYATTRLQVHFGAYKRTNRFFTKAVLDAWVGYKAHMLLGLLTGFWFLMFLLVFTKFTGNPVLVGPQNTYFSFGCYLILATCFTRERVLNYDYYVRVFSTWSPSKKRRWDISMAVCMFVSCVLAFYLNIKWFPNGLVNFKK
jgi:hypothetical protein